MGSFTLELCRQEKLLQLMEERGFVLCQQNGQRSYGGPPANWGTRPPPPRECEIFIGRLPRTCFEDELIPLFASIGELYEFRLMLDFSGSNRGFAYAHYTTEESALQAIKLLNHFEIRPGHFIGVLRSKNNCRLLFSNIKDETDSISFAAYIRNLSSDVQKVCVFANFEELKNAEIGLTLEVEEVFQEKIGRYAPNSKFAIVEYESHRAAAMARRLLIPKLGHIYGIDWAIPTNEKNPFDQSYENLCEVRFTSGNNFAKARPVPPFNPRRSNFDKYLHMIAVLRNVGKYFKYLLNTSLHNSMRKGDIPLTVYLEIERKIIDPIKTVEHCGQATQLILNYLKWYGEKRVMIIEPKLEKIFSEVKFYSDKILQMVTNRFISPNESTSDIESYVNNTLLVHLNFCYFMAIFLSGDERENVCGSISDALNWFESVMQKVRLGNENVTKFLLEISELAGEMENDRRKGDNTIYIHHSRKRKADYGSAPYSPRSIPYIGQLSQRSRSYIASTRTCQECLQNPGNSSCYVTEVYHPGNYTRHSDFINWRALSRSSNLIGSLCAITSSTSELIRRQFDHSGHISPIIQIPEGGSSRLEELSLRRNESRKSRELAVLVPPPSKTEYVSYMPKQFYNIVKYYKFLIIATIQKCLEKCEITLFMYREIIVNVINNITNIEGCIQGISLIMDYLTFNRDVRLVGDGVFKILQDIRHNAELVISYIYNRESNAVSRNGDIDEYYCHVLPNQMSFLYHLSLVLSDEDKNLISGRLVDSIQFVNDLVQKNKAGDVEVLSFFEKISGTRGDNSDGISVPVREIMKNIFDEFNNLLGQFKGNNDK